MARWSLLIFVLVGLLAYGVAASATDFDAVVRVFTQLDAGTWLLVLALSLVNYGLRFGRWHVYLRDLGHRVPAVRHLAIYVTGFAMAPTPGKIGEGIRALYLKPFGIGIGRTISALYAERVLDVMAVSLLAALLFAAPIAEFRWLAIVGGVIAVALLALQHPAVLALTRRLLDRLPGSRLRAAGTQIAAFQQDVTALVRGQLLLGGLVLGLVAWGAEGLGLYLVADALGLELGLWSAIGIYATAMLAGALSFIPGGLGSAEATMVALLALTGTPLPVAIGITALVRIATLWFAVALGAAAWLGLEATRRPISPAEAGPRTG